jgi:hypothetical protein
MKKKDILQSISAEEALTVLQQLVATSPAIREKAEGIALALLADVDVDGVADEVLWALESLDVEDVWDNSGSKRDGYVDTTECAWQMFEDALEPFLQQMQKFQDLSMNDQAKSYCMGLVKGIYAFETESTTEYKDWASDAPGEYFVSIYKEWKKQAKRKKDLTEVNKFIQDLDPEKAKYCGCPLIK